MVLSMFAALAVASKAHKHEADHTKATPAKTTEAAPAAEETTEVAK